MLPDLVTPRYFSAMVIAIIQDCPVINELSATIQKTIIFINQAASKGADLVVFGETWLCGYPVWLDVCSDVAFWDHEPVKQIWSEMYDSAVDLSQNDLTPILNAAKENKVWVVIGANEKISKGRGNGTLFNSVITISDKGEIVNSHRKLMPTYTEKLVHGTGDGAGLRSVSTHFGNLGSLICWEHWMPLTRQAMHEEAEDIHIALWPFVKEMHQICARQYAFEGRCHVISVGQVMSVSQLPTALDIPKGLKPSDLVMKGGSSIYGPDGSIVLSPVIGEKKIIFQELDLSINVSEKMNLSVSGHYNRPDVFDFSVNKKRQF
jgi:predicted amidohydrolase